MLKPIKGEVDGEEKTLVCEHWRSFPPLTAFMDADIEALRAKGQISTELAQRHAVWKKVCGLVKMEADKCSGCPFVRELVLKPHSCALLVTLDGKESTPVVDPTTLGSHRSKRRSHLLATSGSVENRKQQAKIKLHADQAGESE